MAANHEERKMLRLSNDETNLLVSLILKHKDVLESKKTDAITNAAKARRWNEVERDFNSNEYVRRRTLKQLKKSWENIKMRKRKQSAQEREEAIRRGVPVPSTSTEVTPKVETTTLPSVSGSPTNATDSDFVWEPSISLEISGDTSECVLMDEVGEVSELQHHDRRTPTPAGGHMEDVPSMSNRKKMPATRGAAVEKELEVRLEQLETFKVKEVGILELRKKEALLALAIKEQELANAKAAGELKLKNLQMELEFRRRILEVELQIKEAQLRRELEGMPP